MTSTEIQSLLDDANCLVCQGMTLPEAIKIVLLNQISGAQAKVYRALLTQTGVNAPVATVLENTLGGTLIWTYDSPGRYIGTLANSFPVGKTLVFMGASNSPGPSGGIGLGSRNSNDSVRVESWDLSAPAKGDDILGQTSIQILVYP